MPEPVSSNGSFARSERRCEKSGQNDESASELVERCDRLIAELVAATKVLDAKGVTDRSKIDAIDACTPAELDASLAIPERRSQVAAPRA